jgi:CheY-like chemotaxis protein
MAQGLEMLWRSGADYRHVIADIAADLAHPTVPIGLIGFRRRRPKSRLGRILGFLAPLVLLCGAWRWPGIIALWLPLYLLDGVLNRFTACVTPLWARLARAIVSPGPGRAAVALDAFPAARTVGSGRRWSVPVEDKGTEAIPARSLRVLVVDDVLLNLQATRSFLLAAGHRVTCFDCAKEAIVAAANIDFDVVLMDLRMPGMNGLEAARQIRALDGPRGQVPIVALTAYDDPHQIEECREAGMDGHVLKPRIRKTLLKTIAEVCEPGSGCVT